MTHRYRVYGLRLDSNLPLSGVVTDGDSHAPDVSVLFGGLTDELSQALCGRVATRYASSMRTTDGTPTLVVSAFPDHGLQEFVYADGTRFVLDEAATHIWASWPSELTLEDTLSYLLGPILGYVLRLHGRVCLHASAFAVDDRAIALVGPAGAGKSTTAAALVDIGYPVMCEDVLPVHELGDLILAESGYPRIRLWPDSAHHLHGSPDALPKLTPSWDKRYLDLGEHGRHFHDGPLALGAFYLLLPRRDLADYPRTDDLEPRTALMTLVANTYNNYMLDSAQRADEFRLLGRMIRRLPVRTVTPHTDIERLPALCARIIDDAHGLIPTRTTNARLA